MLNSKTLCASILLLGSTAAAAQDMSERSAQVMSDPYLMLQEFSRCDAVYNSFAELANDAGYPANADQLRGTARGAAVSATLAAYYLVGVPDEDISDAEFEAWREQLDYRLQQIENIKASESTRLNAYLETGSPDFDALSACTELNDLQTVLIEEARRAGLF